MTKDEIETYVKQMQEEYAISAPRDFLKTCQELGVSERSARAIMAQPTISDGKELIADLFSYHEDEIIAAYMKYLWETDNLIVKIAKGI